MEGSAPNQEFHYNTNPWWKINFQKIPTFYLVIGIVVIGTLAICSSILIVNSSQQSLTVPNNVVQEEGKLALEETVAEIESALTPTAAVSSLKPSVTPQPSASPTASWSTFTSQRYGYSFDYPPGWTATRTPQSDPLILDYIVLNPVDNASGSAITLSYGTRTESQALSIYSQQGIPILVNSVPSTIKEIQDSDGNVSYQVIVPDASNTAIWYANKEYADIFHQILQTFTLF